MPAHAVDIVAVSCHYSGRTAVDAVDLKVAPGEHVALTGTNGSGKSTLLRAVLGLHPGTRGRIEVGGRGARRPAEWAARRREVAWIPQKQTGGRFPLKVAELLVSSGAAARAGEAARDLGLADLLDRPVGTLSGGQLQRAYLARALGQLAAGAGVLLADEPTAALDFDGQERVAALLGGLEVTVLVATHDQAVVGACERTVQMAAGRLRELA
ncbi:metal ABC transporter ATP-binding protein [Spirillospora sp. CA-294931]|uniref:metal ABC transporter ATP-binding protein n=1 Tax=Spirillospora sp. CA-294931 TaxID=3240042 RepID=UPI003D918464